MTDLALNQNTHARLVNGEILLKPTEISNIVLTFTGTAKPPLAIIQSLDNGKCHREGRPSRFDALYV